MKTLFQDIKDFHAKFGLDYAGPPRQLDVDLAVFRMRFLAEELGEYAGLDEIEQSGFATILTDGFPRFGAPDLADQLDALVDLVYVALGTAYLQGFDFDEAWRRVHAANMAKVRARADGSDSARSSSHDVVKPAGWTAPDLSDLVR